MATGPAAEVLSRRYARWRDSGYDTRLTPEPGPDRADEDAYDLWASSGYSRSDLWEPGESSLGGRAVPKKGTTGYRA